MKAWSLKAALLMCMLSLASLALAEAKPLNLDAVHSRVGFTASTLLFDVDGQFKKFELNVDGDAKQPTSAKIMLSIDTSSIDTGIEKRDEHLKSPDFFDAKKYPKISFTSDSVTQSGNMLSVAGTLDMHGKKKKVSIPFKVVQGKNGAGVDSTAYKGKLTLKRSDFGIGAESVAAKISLEDEVNLDLLIVSVM